MKLSYWFARMMLTLISPVVTPGFYLCFYKYCDSGKIFAHVFEHSSNGHYSIDAEIAGRFP